MHASCMNWVAAQALSGPTLDIGSYDVNGSPRDLFTGRYLGVDMRLGPGVDLVCDSGNLPLADGEFRTVLCLNMLEHDPHPWLTVREAYRVLVPGGTLLCCAPDFDFPFHEYPSDFWRFSGDGLRHLLTDAGFEVRSAENAESCWMLAAEKP